MGESLGTSWSKTLMKDEKEKLLYCVTIQKSWGIGQNTVICRSYKAIYVLQKNIENIMFHSTENKFLNSFRISLFQHEEIFAR